SVFAQFHQTLCTRLKPRSAVSTCTLFACLGQIVFRTAFPSCKPSLQQTKVLFSRIITYVKTTSILFALRYITMVGSLLACFAQSARIQQGGEQVKATRRK